MTYSRRITGIEIDVPLKAAASEYRISLAVEVAAPYPETEKIVKPPDSVSCGVGKIHTLLIAGN
jgi:hypothetical protein